MYEFIILRHISKHEHNIHWIKCVNSIKEFYPTHFITILDDKSDKNILKNTNKLFEKDPLIIFKDNTTSNSLAELYPYYYISTLSENKTFIIVHDTTYFIKFYDFSIVNNKFLFQFNNHQWDETEQELELISMLNYNNILSNFYTKKDLWCGMLGVMSIVNSEFIKFIYNKYNLSIFENKLINRKKRMCLERVLAVIFFIELSITPSDCSLFGDFYGSTKNEKYFIKTFQGR